MLIHLENVTFPFEVLAIGRSHSTDPPGGGRSENKMGKNNHIMAQDCSSAMGAFVRGGT